MAVERQHVIKDTHLRNITTLGYNPSRREILSGYEDGIVKTFEADSGKLLNTFAEHRGWITDFLFWSDVKIVFSSSNDGMIIAWASGGTVGDRINIGHPVYCMTMNQRRHQLLCGLNSVLQLYNLDDEKESGHYLKLPVAFVVTNVHTDIVRCISCLDARIYSAGYDKKLVFYDTSYSSRSSITPAYVNSHAHDAAISCLVIVKDTDQNNWLITGGFDRSLKIWTMEGKLVHNIDKFGTSITGICYVPRTRTAWVASGTANALVYDPKSGDNVTEFVGTFHVDQNNDSYYIQQLKFFPELNQVVASTNRRHILVWKYNSSGCITALRTQTAVESLAYTKKSPILLFCGDTGGVVTKWERMQSNHFLYTKEYMLLADAKKAIKRISGNKPSNKQEDKENSKVQEKNRKNKHIKSYYNFEQKTLPPELKHAHSHTTILRLLFVESLDILVAACEDNNIYIWGFDEAAVEALKMMKMPDEEQDMIKKYQVLLGQESELIKNMLSQPREEEAVTNRVAGFVCKQIFSHHTSCVSAVAVVDNNPSFPGTFLISGGWDKRICIWDLQLLVLKDVLRNPNSPTCSMDYVELACDGAILDLTYSTETQQFAYASSDRMVYLRQFSTDGSKLTLVNTLQGHYGEVTSVQWNSVCKKWVTGSEDGSVCVWAADGLNECEQTLAVQGPVSSLCVDQLNGALVVAVGKTIKVYDVEQFRLVQKNVGHNDLIRCVIHVPERNQYLSCGADQTVRIWNAWRPLAKKRRSSREKASDDPSQRTSGSYTGNDVRKASQSDSQVTDDEDNKD